MYCEDDNYDNYGIEQQYYDYYNAEEESSQIDYEIAALDHDNSYTKHLQCDITQKLLPIIESVLDTYEYQFSAMYADTIDKDALNQMCYSVLEIAQADFAEINDLIAACDNNNHWGNYWLLYALIESLVIRDIYFLRRPKQAKLSKYYL